jgi:hypothetical protein
LQVCVSDFKTKINVRRKQRIPRSLASPTFSVIGPLVA